MSNKSLYFTKAVIFTLLAFAIVFWNTQAFGKHWQKTFEVSGSEGGKSVQQTTDGGFIIAGSTGISYPGHAYPCLIKTDANGNKLWSKTFKGVGHGHANSVQQTTDGGYIIAGSVRNFQDDVYLLKTDDSGNLLWEKTFGGSFHDAGYSVQQTTDGGFIIVGITENFGADEWDVYLIKTDADGNELWSKTFGGPDHDYGMSVQQTTDGGYIIAGSSPPGYCLLLKTDANGNALWSKTFFGYMGAEGNSVQQTTDGGYIIAGFTGSTEVPFTVDFYLLKTDASGNELWHKTFGGAENDFAYSVQQTKDGGYIIAGIYEVIGYAITDVYLVKTDANGNKLWSKRFGGLFWDVGYSVQQTTDGGYIIAGETNSFGANYYDVYLIYYKPEWETVYKTLFDSPSDLELLRQYRDEILSNTTRGVIYKTLLYRFSEQALEVLLSNSELISQAKVLIEANRDAVLDVLDGYEGIIYNTGEIVAFLDAFAKKSPPILKILVYIVKI
jgi:hypothetical protein